MTILLLFVLFFIALAVFNLTYTTSLTWFGIAASIIWPLLVMAVIWAFVYYDGGARQNLINLLGNYSNKQFVEELVLDEGETFICFGYELLGRDHYYLKVNSDAVVSVDWSTGQATDRAGRDMNDWSVAMWYHDPDGSAINNIPGPRQYQEIYMIWPPSAKEKTEALGRAFIAFLQEAGIDLQPTDKDTEFEVNAISQSYGPAEL